MTEFAPAGAAGRLDVAQAEPKVGVLFVDGDADESVAVVDQKAAIGDEGFRLVERRKIIEAVQKNLLFVGRHSPIVVHNAIPDAIYRVQHVDLLTVQFPNCLPLAIAGFSLGGNFALRVALRAPQAGIPLAYALAVCPAISPSDAMNAIERAPWFYEAYFLRKWRRSLLTKQRAFPQATLFSPDDMRGSLRELTRALVLRHTSYPSIEAYFDAYSIAGDRLSTMHVPTTILTAADDPIIPVEHFRNLQLPACVELDIAPSGGHCGFIRSLALTSWTEDYIAERMQRNIPAIQ